MLWRQHLCRLAPAHKAQCHVKDMRGESTCVYRSLFSASLVQVRSITEGNMIEVICALGQSSRVHMHMKWVQYFTVYFRCIQYIVYYSIFCMPYT